MLHQDFYLKVAREACACHGHLEAWVRCDYDYDYRNCLFSICEGLPVTKTGILAMRKTLGLCGASWQSAYIVIPTSKTISLQGYRGGCNLCAMIE